jgi:hypothetical protein
MVTFYIAIVKFIFVLKLELSKPQRKHLLSMIHGIILCAGRKNITQIHHAARQDCHLSSMTHFLNHSPWCITRRDDNIRLPNLFILMVLFNESLPLQIAFDTPCHSVLNSFPLL